MANDRHRAVARAKHKMEVSLKRKEKEYFNSLSVYEKVAYIFKKAVFTVEEALDIIFLVLDKHNFIISKERLQKIFGGDE
ncbi:hypothetical protein [Facklamia sp. P12934]|uniref:hypothetical protein n=1 Tax=unclassified Facklamia TaxID=2622293 RepID=UPI003D17A21F